ncbi:InlB B-repeat-containing protein [Lentiprolixibacter aurantiacus]|uniref:Bacterial repeat domain-containing protein n=1 Tax=Lentiprolixibacter aurantiacus TaxID=2993939 RepID=A0AAE3MMS6_9FLAO|nr:hypothetical protein [Lentiprolixibacter aurantiacus]MCX2719722.1 hypothetical protein [Lentiprolixibacter aurantiacus]
MKEIKKSLGMMIILLISCFVLDGCSNQDSNENNGGGGFDFVFNVTVSPEDSGRVETYVYYVEYSVYRIELNAIPSAGFSFSHWEGDFCISTINPCSRSIFTYYEESPYTVNATAVFEAIE